MRSKKLRYKGKRQLSTLKINKKIIGGAKCYNKKTGKMGKWPPCRGDFVLPGDLPQHIKDKIKKNKDTGTSKQITQASRQEGSTKLKKKSLLAKAKKSLTKPFKTKKKI